MKLLDSLSDAAGRFNEDGIYIDRHLACVLDGATSLKRGATLSQAEDPADNDAIWCVEAIKKHFNAYSALAADPHALVRNIQQALGRDYKGATDYYPSSAMAYACEDGDELVMAQLGDTPIVLAMTDGSTKVLPGDPRIKRHESGVMKKVAQMIADHPDFALADFRQGVFEDIASLRSRMNEANGYGTLSPKPDALPHLIVTRHKRSAVKNALLMSDGFFAICETFRACSAGDLMARALAPSGLKDIVRELRRIQAEDEPCRKFPRLKKGDDATAILIQVSP